MSSKKLITIVGVTGNQGGSIIDTVLASEQLSAKYALRGISRDPSNSKAKALIEQGVEIVSAELDDIDSLTKAFEGSYGVFGVTDFWNTLSKAAETQQGKNIYTAAVRAKTRHLVFSTLPPTTTISGGKYTHVDHFDSKADASAWLMTQQQQQQQSTSSDDKNDEKMLLSLFQPAFYINQWPMFLHPSSSSSSNPQETKTKTTNLILPCPDPNIAWPCLAPRLDSGKYILGLFETGTAADGIAVQGVSCWTTPQEVCEKLTQAGAESGRKVEYKAITMEAFELGLGREMPQQVKTEMTEMVAFFGEFGYFGPEGRERQGESEKFLLEGGGELLGTDEHVEGGKPWFADA